MLASSLLPNRDAHRLFRSSCLCFIILSFSFLFYGLGLHYFLLTLSSV